MMMMLEGRTDIEQVGPGTCVVGGENGGWAVEAQGLHRRCSLGAGSRRREDSSGGHKCHTDGTEGRRGWQKQGALQPGKGEGHYPKSSRESLKGFSGEAKRTEGISGEGLAGGTWTSSGPGCHFLGRHLLSPLGSSSFCCKMEVRLEPATCSGVRIKAHNARETFGTISAPRRAPNNC